MNKRMKKKNGLGKPTIKKRLAKLLAICIEKGLNFEYLQIIGKVEIRKKDHTDITHGYIKDWKHETSEQAITRMEKELKEYVNRN